MIPTSNPISGEAHGGEAVLSLDIRADGAVDSILLAAEAAMAVEAIT